MARNIAIIGLRNLKSILVLPEALRFKNCRHCGAVWIAVAMLPFAVYGWLPTDGFREVASIISEQVTSSATIALDTFDPKPTAPATTLATVAPVPAPALTLPPIASTSSPAPAVVAAVLPSTKPVETAALPETTCAADFAGILTQNKLTFGFDSAKVLPENAATLDQLAAIAKRCDAFDIRVDGHTDLNGTATYNQKLSEQRAETVRKELLKRGANPKQIASKGFGSSKPLSSAKTVATVAPGNRRIEFTVTERAAR